ncbi:MAG: septum formation protein Maf [Candidatus Coatesbacteria bacterium]|nr:septum formation protein Maf [Candidatus Coatesbacteria bacterium]
MTQRIVLASASPRRAFLLERAGIPFDVIEPGDVEEGANVSGEPREQAKGLAQLKARSVAISTPKVCLGCDTIVAIDSTILGKPSSKDDARSMLQMLSGEWHRVITGVSLIDAATGREYTDYAETEVRFAELGADEIDAYISSGEPFGKAGAYGIQGGASSFVIGLKGPLDNVIGLPVRLVRQMLSKMEA